MPEAANPANSPIFWTFWGYSELSFKSSLLWVPHLCLRMTIYPQPIGRTDQWINRCFLCILLEETPKRYPRLNFGHQSIPRIGLSPVVDLFLQVVIMCLTVLLSQFHTCVLRISAISAQTNSRIAISSVQRQVIKGMVGSDHDIDSGAVFVGGELMANWWLFVLLEGC